MNLGLANKVAIVTGASSGIGLATAHLFRAEGASVAMLARGEQRLLTAAAHVAAAAGEPGQAVLPLVCDVLDGESVEQSVARVVEKLGGVDILINNAGAGRMSTFRNTTDAHWREELDIKFFSLIHPTRAVVPSMKERGGGRIINVNAILARQPEPYMVATSAARAGALNLSRSLATELAADNILVNSVLLGLIESDQWRRRHISEKPELPLQAYLAEIAGSRRIPLGRLGTPEEVAGIIVFLCSRYAAYVTGATLEIGGGKNAYV